MSQSRVLLVENISDNFELVRFRLECAGYQVVEAYDGQIRPDFARQELPDLVLMDLSLPRRDEWTGTRELKADTKTASIPLLALTAHILPGDRNRAFESGFNGYISKLFNIQSFAEDIAHALQPKNTSKKV